MLLKTHAESVCIRAARLGDLDAMRHIYNESVAHSVATFDEVLRTADEQAAWWQALVSAGWPVMVAASAQDEVLGFASLGSFRARSAYRITAENSVYVKASAQGQGIGLQLLTCTQQAAIERKLHSVIAVIALPNPGSVRLHAKLGFTDVGTLREAGLKFGRFVDVLLMQWLVPGSA